jgi:hypothetical protein
MDWMRLGVAANTGFLKTVINPPVPLQTVIFVVVKRLKRKIVNLTFISPYIANIFSEYNQQDVT